MTTWFQLALSREIATRGLKVALIVGTILTVINQGDMLVSGAISATLIGKVLLTFLVPYCVSTYAGVEALLPRSADTVDSNKPKLPGATPMLTSEDDANARALHEQYMDALGSGDMDKVATLFTFPAVFKGFLDDTLVATDKASLLSAYEQLIAVAPKAHRMELSGIDVSYVRPKVFMLAMKYKQFDAADEVIHDGQALYFMKPVKEQLRIFAVI